MARLCSSKEGIYDDTLSRQQHMRMTGISTAAGTGTGSGVLRRLT